MAEEEVEVLAPSLHLGLRELGDELSSVLLGANEAGPKVALHVAEDVPLAVIEDRCLYSSARIPGVAEILSAVLHLCRIYLRNQDCF